MEENRTQTLARSPTWIVIVKLFSCIVVHFLHTYVIHYWISKQTTHFLLPPPSAWARRLSYLRGPPMVGGAVPGYVGGGEGGGPVTSRPVQKRRRSVGVWGSQRWPEVYCLAWSSCLLFQLLWFLHWSFLLLQADWRITAEASCVYCCSSSSLPVTWDPCWSRGLSCSCLSVMLLLEFPAVSGVYCCCNSLL